MALTIGASGANGYATSATGVSPSLTTQATCNLLVFVHEESTSTTAPTITDSKGNASASFVAVGSYQAMTAGSYANNRMWVFVALGITGGSSHTVTATKTDGYPSVHVIEIRGTGVALASPSNAAQVDSATPYTSGSLSPSGAALLVGCWGVEGTSGNVAATWGNSFTGLTAVPSFDYWQGGTGYRIVSAGTYEVSITLTGSHVADVAVKMVAFVESGGGGTVTLDGAAVAGASAAASITKAVPLSGAATGGAQASGSVTHLVPLAGAAVASSTAGGSLSLSVSLSGTGFAQALAAAQMDHGVPLAGGGTAGASAAAALSLTMGLSGAAVAQLVAGSAELAHGVPLAGGGTAGAVAAGSLLGSTLLTGAAEAGAAAGGTLSLLVSLSAQAVADSLAAGALSVHVNLGGGAVLAALAGGELTVTSVIELQGAATGSAGASGTLTVGVPSFDTIARIDCRGLQYRRLAARSTARATASRHAQRSTRGKAS